MNGLGNILKDYLEYHKITQTEFALRLGISFKHMNEIINGNTMVSPELMIAISLLTDIDINLIVLAEQMKGMHNYLYGKFDNEKNIKQFLNSFYINEMSKRNWITLRDKDNVVQNGVDLLNFMKVKNFDIYKKYANSNILYKKKDDANLLKVYLWLTHCDNLIKGIEVPQYNSKKFNELLDDLKLQSNKKFNKDDLIKLLKKYGIILVIEDALRGTKVRGCVKVKDKTPVIYLTNYYKEKSSFYFALYHELGHIKKDYNKLMSKILADDDMEFNSDSFALNCMINEDNWKLILANYNNEKEIENISKKYNIPKCFIYSRLAFLKLIDYKSTKYNKNIERIEL